ncbi:MAG: hypothetical protein ABI700_12550 [Chloroflexota bacterium]
MQKLRLLFVIVCLGLLAAIGFGANSTALAQDQSGDVVFKTPEDAITLYMQGIAESDIDKILQACAINEMSENFKLDLSIARIGVLDPYQSQAPSDYAFYAEMNKAQQSARILSQVRLFTFSLLSSEDIASGTIIRMDEARTAQFIKDVDPARLAQIEVKKIGIPFPRIIESANYVENTTKLAQVYGADEYSERVVLFQFEGNDYGAGFTLLRYGENWKIMSASSPVANLVPSGATGKITEADFEKMLQ